MQGLAAAQYGLAPALASTLLDSLWQNAALAFAAGLSLRAMKSSSPAARHNVAMGFLLAMVLLPALQFVRFWMQSGPDINDGLLPAVTAPKLSAASGLFVQESSPWAAPIVLAWLAGAAVMLIRHVSALRALSAMDRSLYEPLPPRWRLRADQMRGTMGIAREVAVRVSAETVAPFAARLLRPVIWLPLSLVTHAPADQIEALLAHELAHIARKDWLWNGVQCAIEALLFFNPAVWWLGRRIRQEREHACDDLAVKACGDPVALAEALAALECRRQPFNAFVLAAQGGSLMQRITRLLSGPPSRGRWGAIAVLGALTVSGFLLLTQVGVASGRLPNLNVRSSTAGALGPGDYREITATGVDKVRYYRASVDARGKLSQVYREDGKSREIDAGVARWIDQVSRMTVAPTPAEIARRHQIPEAARIEARPEIKTLFALVASHPNVVARLGTPATATSRPIGGNIRLDDAGGEADIALEMRGPKGSAMIDVEGDLRNRLWTLKRVDPR